MIPPQDLIILVAVARNPGLLIHDLAYRAADLAGDLMPIHWYWNYDIQRLRDIGWLQVSDHRFQLTATGDGILKTSAKQYRDLGRLFLEY